MWVGKSVDVQIPILRGQLTFKFFILLQLILSRFTSLNCLHSVILFLQPAQSRVLIIVRCGATFYVRIYIIVIGASTMHEEV